MMLAVLKRASMARKNSGLNVGLHLHRRGQGSNPRSGLKFFWPYSLLRK